MNCRRADQLFSAAWEDELTLVEREALESHMSGCSDCRRAYDELVRVMEAVQGMPRAEAAGDFSEGVWARIRAAEAPAARRGRVLSIEWSWASFRPALAAAACLVVVGGAIAYWSHNNNQSPAHTLAQRPVASPSRATEPPPADAKQAPAPAPVAAQNQPAKIAMTQSVPAEKAAALEPQPLTQDEIAGVTGQIGAPASEGVHVRGGRSAETAFAAPAAAKQDSGAVNDSLFDHRYDMEFALDPVHLKKTGKGRLTPASPTPAEAQGKPAKVTF
jgi:Putative zinc-finger